MKDKFNELFAYNYEMNKQVIQLITQHEPTISEKIIELISHTINAHQIWNARINKEEEFGVWQLNSWENIPTINAQNYDKTINILQNNNLSTIVSYRNSKGEQFNNKIEDILFHIINHSTYHRAQIATECRNLGIKPLVTDYIMYKRNIS
ncbi:MAG: DinB family protein [Sphingobacterium composti]